MKKLKPILLLLTWGFILLGCYCAYMNSTL